MHKLFVIAACLLSYGYCFGQRMETRENPMQYALIAENEARPPGNHSLNGIQFVNDKSAYQRYVKDVVFNYNVLFSLSKKERSALAAGMAGCYVSTGVSSDAVHAFVASKLKAILTYTRYLEWIRLRSYPEYHVFYEYALHAQHDWDWR